MTANELLKCIVLRVVRMFIISRERKKSSDVLMLAVKVLKIIRDTNMLLLRIPNNRQIWNLALNPFDM